MPIEILCPQCHRLFTREVEEKELVNHDFAMVQEEPAALMEAARGTAWEPLLVRKEIARYRYIYRCKHCGHEWTEVKTEVTHG
jgi:peptide subunit release factor 1 (eRF1)